MTVDVDSVKSHVSATPKRCKGRDLRKRAVAQRSDRWTDAEDRFVKAHRLDGYLLISEGLAGRGYDRTPDAVRYRAYRKWGVRLAKYPVGGMRKCVACGRWEARPNTVPGRAGYCEACWKRRKAQAMREGADERDAENEYQREKKARRKRGLGKERS